MTCQVASPELRPQYSACVKRMLRWLMMLLLSCLLPQLLSVNVKV